MGRRIKYVCANRNKFGCYVTEGSLKLEKESFYVAQNGRVLKKSQTTGMIELNFLSLYPIEVVDFLKSQELISQEFNRLIFYMCVYNDILS